MSPNPKETADLFTFTEEIFNGKPHFLCRDLIQSYLKNYKGRQLEFANFYSQLVSRIPKFDELSC